MGGACEERPHLELRLYRIFLLSAGGATNAPTADAPLNAGLSPRYDANLLTIAFLRYPIWLTLSNYEDKLYECVNEESKFLRYIYGLLDKYFRKIWNIRFYMRETILGCL